MYCKISHTPNDSSTKIDDSGPPVANPTLYLTLANTLQYLMFTLPDIIDITWKVILMQSKMKHVRDQIVSKVDTVLKWKLDWNEDYVQD